MPNPSMLEREAAAEPPLSLDKWRQLAQADPRWKLPQEILALVAEAVACEREACAEEAENNRFGWHCADPVSERMTVEEFAKAKGDAIAQAIRARRTA